MNDDWEKLFSENIEYSYPSEAQIKVWLNEDNTNTKELNNNYSDLQKAIELYLKAKTQGWELGIVTIQWSEGETSIKHIYNYFEIEPGLIMYINPQNDNLWSTTNYEFVTAGKTWDIDGNSNIFVTNVGLIIGL